VAVIMVTAYGDVETCRKAIERGARVCSLADRFPEPQGRRIKTAMGPA